MHLKAGMSIPGLSTRITDERLRLAVDLFLGSFFEGSSYAQFLARITVLEVLREEQAQVPEVRDAVARWVGDVDAMLAAGEIDEPNANSLRGRLRQLERDSIGRAITRLVGAALGPGAAREAGGLYELRSRIVHYGELDPGGLGSELSSLTALVQRLLRVVLIARPEVV